MLISFTYLELQVARLGNKDLNEKQTNMENHKFPQLPHILIMKYERKLNTTYPSHM